MTHTLWLSDDTIWCSVCGQHTTEKVYGLKRACHPVRHGTRFALRLLASGILPETRKPFRRLAIPQHEWQSRADFAQCGRVSSGHHGHGHAEDPPQVSKAQARLQALRERIRQRSCPASSAG